jgi:hypothetical protein
MNILEKEIEEIIYTVLLNYGSEEFLERGLPISGIPLRQVNLGTYGIADMITVYINGAFKRRVLHVHIYELKRGVIGIGTLLQASRYYIGVHHFIESKGINKYFDTVLIDTSIIGSSVDLSNDFVFACDQYGVNAYTFKLDFFDGLTFDRINGYRKSNAAFPDELTQTSIGLIKKLYGRK